MDGTKRRQNVPRVVTSALKKTMNPDSMMNTTFALCSHVEQFFGFLEHAN